MCSVKVIHQPERWGGGGGVERHRVMEWGGVKCWLSMSIFLSGAESAASSSSPALTEQHHLRQHAGH